MKNKALVVISFVLSLLYLLYIVMDYYGLIRYIKLYFTPIKHYSESYYKLDKIGKDRNVIVLMTSSSNIHKLPFVIKSLLDQTIKVDLITVVMPQNSKYVLPNNLKDSVSVFYSSTSGESESELQSLITTIQRESESTTRIITLGSRIYGKDFIETLLTKSENNPNSIICVSDVSKSSEKKYIDLCKGTVFYTKFFNPDFLDLPEKDGTKKVNKYFEDFPKHIVEYEENYNC